MTFQKSRLDLDEPDEQPIDEELSAADLSSSTAGGR
jgi:hypothetical protein